MNVYVKRFLFFVVVAFFVGCQGGNGSSSSQTSNSDNNISDSNVSIPDSNLSANIYTVILPVSSTVLTTNNQVVNIDVRVFDGNNNPYSVGKIIKINPNDVLTGRDTGTFDKQESTLVNGVATFVYTAPDDLDKNTSDIPFAFYHDSNSSNRRIYTMSIVPDKNQTTISSYTLTTSDSSDVDMGLSSTKTVSYSVKDSNDNLVKDSNMVSMTVRTLNPSLITLSDSFGNSGNELVLNTKSVMTINLNSNTKSGLVPLKVDAKFKDANGDDHNITEVFNMLVLSGPPTAMSLSYAGTSQQSDRAKFTDRWVLTVTDRYNNLVNTHPAVSVGMLAGFIQDSSKTVANTPNYLYVEPGVNGGSLGATNNTFTAPNNVFDNVDQTNDYLLTFGNGYTYPASGKWDINTNSSKVLDLIDDYNETSVNKLGFAVGHNYRQDTCRQGTEWVANVYTDDSSRIIKDNGSLGLNVEYDYYLVGKDTMLWANLIGTQNTTGHRVRLGESRKITLRGDGITGESYSYPKGFTGNVTLNVSIANTVEWYRNANFFYKVTVGDETKWNLVGDSMGNGVTSCLNNGIAYVTINITSAGKAGTVSLTNMVPANEF